MQDIAQGKAALAGKQAVVRHLIEIAFGGCRGRSVAELDIADPAPCDGEEVVESAAAHDVQRIERERALAALFYERDGLGDEFRHLKPTISTLGDIPKPSASAVKRSNAAAAPATAGSGMRTLA